MATPHGGTAPGVEQASREGSALSGDLAVDVAIIGGGIVGITTARLLKDRGVRVAVVHGLVTQPLGSKITG